MLYAFALMCQFIPAKNW